MKFAAIIEYIHDADKVQSIRPTHREYLASLKEQGRLAASGPFTDGSGALIIYEADSPEQAENLLRSDPFHQGGVFVSWAIRPWNQVM
jgi:uncharacterized protein YciI